MCCEVKRSLRPEVSGFEGRFVQEPRLFFQIVLPICSRRLAFASIFIYLFSHGTVTRTTVGHHRQADVSLVEKLMEGGPAHHPMGDSVSSGALHICQGLCHVPVSFCVIPGSVHHLDVIAERRFSYFRSKT